MASNGLKTARDIRTKKTKAKVAKKSDDEKTIKKTAKRKKRNGKKTA